GVAAGDAAAPPGVGRQVAEKGEGREAHAAKLLDLASPGDIVGLCAAVADFLIEARQGSVEAAGEPEGPVDGDPLGVVEVGEHLADAPLLRRITVEGPLLGDGGEEGHR